MLSKRQPLEYDSILRETGTLIRFFFSIENLPSESLLQIDTFKYKYYSFYGLLVNEKKLINKFKIRPEPLIPWRGQREDFDTYKLISNYQPQT